MKHADVSFHPVVAEWFAGTFSRPSPPQEQGWPVIAAGEHCLILAPTGSGKTLAAFLWSIDELVRTADSPAADSPAGIHTLYISPLKALNNDIHQNLQIPLRGIARMARRRGLRIPDIRIMVRTGDTPPYIRQTMLKRPPHILITTPESLYLLLLSEKGRRLFRTLKYVIVDEIHALCGNKRGVHLSLSLERLMPLCEREPVRIGLSATQRPIDRIAAFLGGQIYRTEIGDWLPRPVRVVDCGLRREMEVQVVSPVEDFTDLPDATVWPDVIRNLYNLIRSHRTTLIFVNMRAQTERIARRLNELHRSVTGDDQAVLALAHHGSLSRETRESIEHRLKNGDIPAVVATASLELGIDIGHIELVVQLESPRQVTGALQRVGRSGHVLHGRSRGILMPLYQADLDDAVAMTQCMLRQDIEETRIPENCLDVLAQHVVAEVCMQEWSRRELYRLVRQSYCYRRLSETAFQATVEMLAGKYAGEPLRALKPRLVWDPVHDRLYPHRGARLIAIQNAGTIPDRGYFGVYLKDDGTRVGEMEEEFAFESRPGDSFFLGSTEWIIEEITQDRILVSPARAPSPRPPFWKGDQLYRDFSTSLKIAAFRRRILEKMKEGRAFSYLTTQCHADRATAENVIRYFRRQLEHTGAVADDRTVVLECFRDSAGEPLCVVHAPFGARVTGAWVMGLVALLEDRWRLQIQYDYNDDGFVLRLPDAMEPEVLENLLREQSERLQESLIRYLIEAPIFSILFRYNAARALLLPRSTPGQRIPLWLQRLRAADLLQAVRKYNDFPILVETYRECLQDWFDLNGVKTVTQWIREGRIELHKVYTPGPSPMCAGILFRFLANHLYEDDQTRTPAQAAAISTRLLDDLLSRDSIPPVVSADIAAEAESRWQHLHPQTRVRSREALYTLIEKLEPISETALRQRCDGDVDTWLRELVRQHRITRFAAGTGAWIVTPDAALFQDPHKPEHLKKQIEKYLRVHGPVPLRNIAAAFHVSEEKVEPLLQELKSDRKVICGRLLADREETLWCDRGNFAELYRRAIARRRLDHTPCDRERFWYFLHTWHGLQAGAFQLSEFIRRYMGFPFPPGFIEQELMASRCDMPSWSKLRERVHAFHQAVRRGDLILKAGRVPESRQIYVMFFPRSSGYLFYEKQELETKLADLPEPPERIYRFLKENGASLYRDIRDGTGLAFETVVGALSELCRIGLVSCDEPASFYAIVQWKEQHLTGTGSETEQMPSADRHRVRQRVSRQAARDRARTRMVLDRGRWFLTTAFASYGRPVDTGKAAEEQARVLLQRYGILIKEWYRREQGLLPWYPIFQVLKRLEWQGQIRRGYFVEGLSGIQFALPQAFETLQRCRDIPAERFSEQPVWLSTLDPACPFGGYVGWGLRDRSGKEVAVVRGRANFLLLYRALPVLYAEQFAARLSVLEPFPMESPELVCKALKQLLQITAGIRSKRYLEIQTIDGVPVMDHELAGALLKQGFEKKRKSLILWPSQAMD